MLQGHYYRRSRRRRYRASRLRQAPATVDIPNAFDEYGKELGPEARIWKTYMKEAEKFDTEELEKWNQSLDVMIVFASLFSAVSTSFLIASMEDLREDPLQTSAQTLLLASQALLHLANNSQPLEMPQSTSSDSTSFTPSISAVFVNAIWILSLSLSITVAFISLIAREWLRMYAVDRGGHVYWRARERQKRLDGIAAWRLPQMMLYLPTVLHSAVFCFSIGLSVYLWDISHAMAFPVIIPTSTLFVFYVYSCLAPFFFQYCPYRTFLGYSYLAFVLRSVVHERSQDWITGRQLAWLIHSYEDPATLDIVLQAVAGIDGGSSFDPLSNYDIPAMVVQRLMSKRAYRECSKLELELYSRALKRFNQFGNLRAQGENVSNSMARRDDDGTNRNTLQRSQGRFGQFGDIRTPGEDVANSMTCHDIGRTDRNTLQGLQSNIEDGYIEWLLSGEFTPSDDNIDILEIGATAVSTFLRSSHQQAQPSKHHFELLDRVIGFLETSNDVANRNLKQRPKLQWSVTASAAILLGCLPLATDPSVLMSCTTRLLRADDAIQDMLLAVFAVTQVKSLREPTRSLLPATMREQQITQVLAYSLSAPLSRAPPGPLELSVIKTLGLLEMLLGFQSCKPDDDAAAKQISQVFEKMSNCSGPLPNPNIPEFPADFNMHQYAMEKITIQVSQSQSLDTIVKSEALSEAYICALYCTCRGSNYEISERVYMLVTEIILRTPSLTAKGCGLIVHSPFPTLSPTLVQLIDDRAIVPLLTRSRNSDDQKSKLFAVSQLCWLTGISLDTSEEHGNKLMLLLERTLCQPRVTVESVKDTLTTELDSIQDESKILESYPRQVLRFLQGLSV